MDKETLIGKLKICGLVRRLTVLESVDSTNSYARSDGTDGLLVIAEKQCAGKGRAGRNWLSARGKGIYMSLNFRPSLMPSQIPWLNLAVSTGVAEAISLQGCSNVCIKWPNDILAGKRKIAGILIETSITGDSIGMATIGMGINTNYAAEELRGLNPRYDGTSIKAETGKPLEHETLIVSVLTEIKHAFNLLSEGKFEKIARLWWARSMFREGSRISFSRNGRRCLAVVAGIDRSGLLKVESGGETSLLTEADISLVEVENDSRD